MTLSQNLIIVILILVTNYHICKLFDHNTPRFRVRVQIPKNDDRIQAYGAWVTDNPHGWNELHPSWEVKVI